MNEWFKNETFWRMTFPIMFDASRLSGTKAEVDGFIKLASIKKTDSVLDLACGAGRHLLELNARGYSQLCGIDSSKYLLAQARQQAQKQGRLITFERADMRDFNKPKTYNVVLSLFSSFGYFNSELENVSVLKNIYTSLKTGGRLLLDVRGREHFISHFDEYSENNVHGIHVTAQREPLENFHKIRNTWHLKTNGRTTSFIFSHWVYGQDELVALCRQAGFKRIKTFGGFNGQPYSNDAKRLIVVAIKS
ncbi:MAG TPA: class I SAM-dependent methyltransferase [Candidatus Saccharimonadales bacterium]|nr:class I SAM-dependent methyltransferase [Candidatus Saccharimonadales bacterium]